MFKDREPSKAKECCWLGERRVVETIYGGDYSTDSENTNPYWKAIHIHGGMEHNLVGYAKYYSCGCIKNQEMVNSQGKLITIEKKFLGIGK